jgi:hypothetical protein
MYLLCVVVCQEIFFAGFVAFVSPLWQSEILLFLKLYFYIYNGNVCLNISLLRLVFIICYQSVLFFTKLINNTEIDENVVHDEYT